MPVFTCCLSGINTDMPQQCWHVHGDALRISDGTSSSLAAGQIRLEQLGGTHVEAQTALNVIRSTESAVLAVEIRLV